MRLPGVEPGSIAWKAIILTVGLQTLACQISEQNLKILISGANIYLTNFQVPNARDQTLLEIVRVCVVVEWVPALGYKLLLQWHSTS